MFPRVLQPRHPEPSPEKSPRVTHTPGAYPPLQPRGDSRDPTPQPASTSRSAPAPETPMNTALTPKPETARTEPATDSPSRLIVGPEVKLKGAEILDCDTLVVEGRVEATMDSRVLRIAEKGAFAGKVSIDVAEIHGNFEGELTARQRLVIHATGRVRGTIRYGSLLIEAGGQISGEIQALELPAQGDANTPGKEADRTKVSLLSSVA
ncbi:MAG: polymer-forming cytoskeletal protein [Candidatus Dactylopiibacterium sp.]|nr:polymer-forming cytoskeletal protein [Candidatus Dactylopiibacterium sp.]